MEGPDRISPEAYLQQMRERMEQALRRVAQAVNDAPDGAWINASEWPVFEEFNDLRRDAYERALQMRADAAASAFSPDRPGDGPGQAEQGSGAAQHADGQRAGERDASAVARAGQGRGRGREQRRADRPAAGRGGGDAQRRDA
jgi:hypothetical protein